MGSGSPATAEEITEQEEMLLGQTDIIMVSEGWVHWTRIIWINAAMVLGLLIGFRISTPVTADWTARIAVFMLAVFNLMIFVVAPRLAAVGEYGIRRNPYGEFWTVIIERPVVTAICSIQLWGVARSLGSTITMFRTSSGDYVKGLPNSESIKTRLIVMSILMFCVGMVWLLGAIGVWRTRKWAWWLALCLNGLASTVTIFLQIFTRHSFLIDIASTTAFVALLLPSTRRLFLVSGDTHVVEQPS